MKFGEYLLQQQFTPWETEYLQYDRVKKVIRQTNDAKIIDQWLQTEFIKIKKFISRQIDTLRYQLALMEQQQKTQPPSSLKILGDDLVYPLYDLHELVRYLDLSSVGFKKLAKSYLKRQQSSSTRDDVNINHESIIKTLDQYYAPLNQLLMRMADIKNNRSRVTRRHSNKMKNLPPIPSPSPSVRDKISPLPPLPRYDNGGDQVITTCYWVHPRHVFELKTLLLIYAKLEYQHPLSTVYFDNNRWNVYNSYLNEQAESTDSIECTWPGLYQTPNGNIQINHLVQHINNVTSIKQNVLSWTSLDSCLRDLQRTSPLPPAKDRPGIRLSTANSIDGGDLSMATALIVEPRGKVNVDEQQLDQALRDRIQQQEWQPMATYTCERTIYTTAMTNDHALIEIQVDTNIMMKEADSTIGQRQGGMTKTSGTRHRHTDLTMMTVIQHLKKEVGNTNMPHHRDSLGKEADTLKQPPTGRKQQEWPGWLIQLGETCDWIHAVPRFSMYAHLVSRLYGDHVPFLPWWLGDFDRSWQVDSPSAYGLSRSAGLRPLLHGDAVSTLRTHPTNNSNKDHTTLDMGNDDYNDDDLDDDDGKDIKLLLPKSTTPPTIQPSTTTKNASSAVSLPAMTTSARTIISNMMKTTTKRMTKPTSTVTTRTKIKVEPKVFFANERTFLSWLQFCALLLTVSLNMINFGGPDDSISRICGGMFIVITILLALYALAKYELRAWNLLTRSNRYRFDDIYGPAILCFLLVVAMLINFGLRLNSSSPHHPPPPP